MPAASLKNRSSCVFFLLALLMAGGYCFADYPRILKATPSDVLYRQLQNDISAYYRAAATRPATPGGKADLPAFNLFSYLVSRNESVFSLAAQFNLPYESLAIINSLTSAEPVEAGRVLFIPNMPGLFVPKNPGTDLEYLLYASMRSLEKAEEIVIKKGQEEVSYYFFPGERFNKTELAFFLHILFRFPLEKGKISSLFGSRYSPITGEIHFHNGIDIAADKGVLVLASRDGTVLESGYSDVLGNYIIVKHEGDYETIYGHLDSILTVLNQKVNSGMILGKVGNTGLSTGPHLHFEIRRKGEPQDPLKMLERDR